MFEQIRYFHAVVMSHSFTKGAEIMNISQSAISQQIKLLEDELGFALIDRKGRSFSLTSAGEYYYCKTRELVTDYEKLVHEAGRISQIKRSNVLRIGYLRTYDGPELERAVMRFSSLYQDMTVELIAGNHEELYNIFSFSIADLTFNDQRRAFKKDFNNEVMKECGYLLRVASFMPVSNAGKITFEDVKDIPCILVSPEKEEETEAAWYTKMLGVKSRIIFARSTEEANLMVLAGRGYMPVLFDKNMEGLTHIPLFGSNGERLVMNLCVFYPSDKEDWYTDEFVDILRSEFNSTMH